MILSRFHNRRRLFVALIAVLLLSPAIGIGGWALALHITGNIHEIEPGAFYRSAQLSGPATDEVIKQYGIRTIINLRGSYPGTDWYDAETAVAARDGVQHIDVAMSANKEPTVETVGRLLEAFRDAPKPILVHCQAGADRSGFASALFELEVAKRPLHDAKEQLSFYYGHFPWLTSKTGAMDIAFSQVAADYLSAGASGS